MKRCEQWRPVLDAEVRRWSGKSTEELLTELSEEQTYEVEFQGSRYQVEAQIIENTDKYVHVIVAVDDGSLPASLRPLTGGFIRNK